MFKKAYFITLYVGYCTLPYHFRQLYIVLCAASPEATRFSLWPKFEVKGKKVYHVFIFIFRHTIRKLSKRLRKLEGYVS